jgi:hypothetical protein
VATSRIFIVKTCVFRHNRLQKKRSKLFLLPDHFHSRTFMTFQSFSFGKEKSGLVIPDAIKFTSRLTPFAVHTRYPGFEFPVSEEEYIEALALAESAVHWAETVIRVKKF